MKCDFCDKEAMTHIYRGNIHIKYCHNHRKEAIAIFYKEKEFKMIEEIFE